MQKTFIICIFLTKLNCKYLLLLEKHHIRNAHRVLPFVHKHHLNLLTWACLFLDHQDNGKQTHNASWKDNSQIMGYMDNIYVYIYIYIYNIHTHVHSKTSHTYHINQFFTKPKLNKSERFYCKHMHCRSENKAFKANSNTLTVNGFLFSTKNNKCCRLS